MKIHKIKSKLDRFQLAMQSVESQLEKLDQVVDTACSPLSDAIVFIQSAYIDTLAENIGTTSDLLDDWAFSYEFGVNPLKIYVADTLVETISDNAQFADLIVRMNNENS